VFPHLQFLLFCNNSNNPASASCITTADRKSLTTRCCHLYFKHDASNGALDDVGSVKAVNAVGAEYATLLTDNATAVHP